MLNTWLTISSVRIEREVLREHFEFALALHDMKIDKGIYTHCKRIPDAKIHTRPAILKKSNLTATLLVFRGTKLAVACRFHGLRKTKIAK